MTANVYQLANRSDGFRGVAAVTVEMMTPGRQRLHVSIFPHRGDDGGPLVQLNGAELDQDARIAAFVALGAALYEVQEDLETT